ncbi:hypothetical protein T492DRAFT_371510 [Pavlovales sp. CCMP2436]|nr:hypothetical protein T492DRAFT_371510 [Pavlovales sp. CCMP2436]|mmetsp:Transcript_43263/g.106805  ORF Transcript_43263/g.106805 Transcript_43263/m.106805 type:complete len:245 (+) Transcript_43263:341-1075(+)
MRQKRGGRDASRARPLAVPTPAPGRRAPSRRLASQRDPPASVRRAAWRQMLSEVGPMSLRDVCFTELAAARRAGADASTLAGDCAGSPTRREPLRRRKPAGEGIYRGPERAGEQETVRKTDMVARPRRRELARRRERELAATGRDAHLGARALLEARWRALLGRPHLRRGDQLARELAGHALLLPLRVELEAVRGAGDRHGRRDGEAGRAHPRREQRAVHARRRLAGVLCEEHELTGGRRRRLS